MSEYRPEPEKKSGNNWWIAGAALFLGYYLGQAEKPADSGTAYAEVPPPIVTTAEDEAVADEAVDEALEAAANAVEAAEAAAATEEFADASEFVAPEEDQVEYQTAYASPPTTTYADTSEVEESAADGVTVETGAVASTGPWTGYQSASNATTYQPSTSSSTYRPRSTYVPPSTSYTAPKCESLGCYGVISTTTGRPRTQYVSGYYRKDGTYVRPYYRSKRN